MTNEDTLKRLTVALPGMVLILLMAGALTYGGKKAVAEATKPKAAVVKTVTVSDDQDAKTDAKSGDTNSTNTSTASSDATATASASAETPAQPTAKTATTNSFVYLRPTAATTGAPLQKLEADTKVQYDIKTGTPWQKVTVNGQEGYIYAKWLTY